MERRLIADAESVTGFSNARDPSQLVLDRAARADTLDRMSKSPTTTIEIDSDLLEELRAEQPGKGDRELIEDMAVRTVGQATVRRVRARFNLSEDEAIAIAVREQHDARAGR